MLHFVPAWNSAIEYMDLKKAIIFNYLLSKRGHTQAAKKKKKKKHAHQNTLSIRRWYCKVKQLTLIELSIHGAEKWRRRRRRKNTGTLRRILCLVGGGFCSLLFFDKFFYSFVLFHSLVHLRSFSPACFASLAVSWLCWCLSAILFNQHSTLL